ncbi:RagB/SusD family nutrient uptake outer membrane protein [Coprobacter tertius]|uniref:RagB/SusD family nutrient uptake outer membrane protein n=1 Tax=Coprobacter tertius TaxID=2944915 RepID=A0ABT1MM11_9BACT|nr:RagB/SusD family nutrient uptake outer membrane protein [Coprobacter tertius]MCP9612773.1 RagB/SusD family nutrient uptake outer membrane protein [Coprobacter tertius]
MKKINILFYICYSFLLSVAIGCADMLDRFPLDALAPETYYNNEQELMSATNNFYGMFPEASQGYGESEDVVCVFTLPEAVIGSRTIPTSGGGWSWDYLRNINFYLEHSHRCPDPAVREQYDGIARFFRAYFYFEKVKRFGDVPWYDKALPSNDADLTKPRDSRIYVINKMLEDIDYAIKYCPDKTELYRVTKWTAMALKSRICLFEGTYRKYHGIPGYEELLDQCIDVSGEFITSSPYSIYNKGDKPYRDLFSSMDAIAQEVILARDYDKGKAVVHEANYNTMASTYGRPGMNKKVVNSYLMTDGSRFTDKADYETMEYYDEMQNRDPRLTQTVVGPGYMRINSTTVESPNFNSSTTGYQIIKWVTDKNGDGYMGSSNDYILFRAAEVYLNFAEAKAERGTLIQEDLNISIKKIRDRIGMPNIDMAAANANPDPYLSNVQTGYANVTGPNKGVILEIRRERTIELILEGFRYYDVMRWKEGKIFEQPYLGMYFPELKQGSGDNRFDVFDMNDGTLLDKDKVDICIYTGKKPSGAAVKNIRKFYKLGNEFRLTNGFEGNIIVHDVKDEPRKWREDRDYLYPIPTQERVLSNGKITQNPNWDDGLSF